MRLVGSLRSRVATASAEALERYRSEAALYLHWPYCRQLCTYCNFNKYTKPERRQGPHFEAAMKAAFLRETRSLLHESGVSKIKSVYFGGGTPSLAGTDTLAAILELVRGLADLPAGTETTIECNPSSSIDEQRLQEYQAMGINRISIGMQGVEDATLKLLGRDHGHDDSLALWEASRRVFGADAVSVDLLFAKPGDTVESWGRELRSVLRHQPHHLSLYQLTPERGTKLFAQVTSGELRLPDGDATADLYAEAVAQLSAAGLRRYEAASFARRGCESRHNGHYWHGVQYVGVGPGAHGRFFPRRQHRRHRRVQVADPLLWQRTVERHGHATHIDEPQSSIEVLSELLATSLRTRRGATQSTWSVFDAENSLRRVLTERPPAGHLFAGGWLRWRGPDAADLAATPRGLDVVDALLPAVLNSVDAFYGSESAASPVLV